MDRLSEFPDQSRMPLAASRRTPQHCKLIAANRSPQEPSMAGRHVEVVEMSGHIIDSLLLPKVLDAIMTRGAEYEVQEFRVGKRQNDPSYARIEVRAPSAEDL